MSDEYAGPAIEAGDGVADGTWADESEFTGWEDGSAEDDGFDQGGPAPTLAVVGRPRASPMRK